MSERLIEGNFTRDMHVEGWQYLWYIVLVPFDVWFNSLGSFCVIHVSGKGSWKWVEMRRGSSTRWNRSNRLDSYNSALTKRILKELSLQGRVCWCRVVEVFSFLSRALPIVAKKRTLGPRATTKNLGTLILMVLRSIWSFFYLNVHSSIYCEK